MTLSLRQILLWGLFLFALMGLLSVGLAWYGLAGNMPSSSYVPTITMVWWGIFRSYGGSDLVGSLGIIAFYILLALIGEVCFRRWFDHTQSTEMFFLRLFLLLLPLQSFRLIILYNAQLGILATRIAWFGRFAAISALLNISLHPSAVTLRRSGYLLGMGLLASLAIAVMMPFDITQPMSSLLHRSGIDTALALSCLSLEILAVLSLSGMSIKHMNTHYHLLSLALLFIVAGMDLSFFGNYTLAIFGAAFMVVGVVGFSLLIQRIYKWL